MTEKQKYYIKNRLMSEFIDLANTCKYLDDFGEFHEGYSFGTKVTFRLGELFRIINKVLDESDEKLTSELLEEQLNDVLGTLSDREKEVLFKLHPNGNKERSFEEVGDELGVSRERIRQIEAFAIRKLKHYTRSKILKDYYDKGGKFAKDYLPKMIWGD